jgi:hypothetical protein
MEAAVVRERYQRAGQDHVLDFIKTITEEEKVSLFKQLSEINVEDLNGLLDAATKELSSTHVDNIEPFSGPIGQSKNYELRERSKLIGMEAIKNHKVAALVSMQR